MSPEDWAHTPWWIQRVYVEGFEAEGLVDYGDSEDAVMASDDTLRGMGLTVVDGG